MAGKDETRRRAVQLRRRMTPAEVALWSALRCSQLGVRFRRQVPIGPFIVDFLCASRKLVVELDGAGHYEMWSDYDERRDRYLARRGYTVLRFENVSVAHDPGVVLLRIREELGFE